MKNRWFNNSNASFPFNNKGFWGAIIGAILSTGVSYAISKSAQRKQKKAQQQAEDLAKQQQREAYQSANKDGVLNWALGIIKDPSAQEYMDIFEHSLPKIRTANELWNYAKGKVRDWGRRVALSDEELAQREKEYEEQYQELLKAMKPTINIPEIKVIPEVNLPELTMPTIQTTKFDFQKYMPLIVGLIIFFMLIAKR